jgi:tRNA(adenine34) deaminase
MGNFNPHNFFMAEALKLAKEAKKLGDHPFGAVIVCDGEIVGKGKCEDSTKNDVTAHAEMLALRDACQNLQTNNLKDCVIYSTNEPCLMCAAAIFQAKITHVVVGLDRDAIPNYLRPRKIRIHHVAEDSGYEIKISSGILKEEILEQFIDLKRK